MDGYVNTDEVRHCRLLRITQCCVLFVVGDGVGEKERDNEKGNKHKDPSHPSSV